jgi:hypothetical protein
VEDVAQMEYLIVTGRAQLKMLDSLISKWKISGEKVGVADWQVFVLTTIYKYLDGEWLLDGLNLWV